MPDYRKFASGPRRADPLPRLEDYLQIVPPPEEKPSREDASLFQKALTAVTRAREQNPGASDREIEEIGLSILYAEDNEERLREHERLPTAWERLLQDEDG